MPFTLREKVILKAAKNKISVTVSYLSLILTVYSVLTRSSKINGTACAFVSLLLLYPSLCSVFQMSTHSLIKYQFAKQAVLNWDVTSITSYCLV